MFTLGHYNALQKSFTKNSTVVWNVLLGLGKYIFKQVPAHSSHFKKGNAFITLQFHHSSLNLFFVPV